MFTEPLLSGITLGGIYALIAMGLTLQYGVARIMNLANGELLVAGGFAAFWLYTAGQVSPVRHREFGCGDPVLVGHVMVAGTPHSREDSTVGRSVQHARRHAFGEGFDSGEGATAEGFGNRARWRHLSTSSTHGGRVSAVSGHCGSTPGAAAACGCAPVGGELCTPGAGGR